MSKMKWIAIVAVICVGVAIGLSLLSTVTTIATAPGRVISKTMETNNIINNYEWFHDAHQAYLAKVQNIATHSKLINLAKSDGDNEEVSRLRVEVSGMQMFCTDLAKKFNANAAKINKNIFKGTPVPDTLDSKNCN